MEAARRKVDLGHIWTKDEIRQLLQHCETGWKIAHYWSDEYQKLKLESGAGGPTITYSWDPTMGIVKTVTP
jgi:hypothetical protein